MFSIADGDVFPCEAGGALAQGWCLNVYEAAGEAGGGFRVGSRSAPRRDGPAVDPLRAAEEATRRARAKVRRYCAANRLNRLGTLTYAGEGCHDPAVLRADVAEFFRALRSELGGDRFPYLWTSEWHPGGHGLHVHFAVGQYIARTLIERAWARGFVHIKLLGDLPVGSGTLEEARKAAGYLSKYLGKDLEDDRPAGLHRYELAQGFQPLFVAVWGRTCGEVLAKSCALMGGPPERTWFSDESEGWHAPPAVWLSWA